MDEIKAQELFDFFNQEGYDLGDFNNFTSALTDDVKREELYSFFNSEGYDVGSLENFTLKKKTNPFPLFKRTLRNPLHQQSRRNLSYWSLLLKKLKSLLQ